MKLKDKCLSGLTNGAFEFCCFFDIAILVVSRIDAAFIFDVHNVGGARCTRTKGRMLDKHF